MILLVHFMFVCSCLYDTAQAIPTAFGLSFTAAVFTFTAALVILEWKERKGAEND